VEIIPLKRYGRMATAVIALLVFAALIYSLITNQNVRWDAILTYLFHPTILSGVGLTIQLTVLAMGVGVALGVCLALMRLSENRVLQWLSGLYIWFFRGTPQLIQLIFWYNLAFLFPTIGIGFFSWDTNTLITPFVAALVGLSLNEGAYMAEIIRGGILGVGKGQKEAAAALGFTPLRTMRLVILPQTMRMIIPPSGNQAISMLKITSLVSVISARDLLTNAQLLYAKNFLVIEMLIVASLWYLLLTSIFTWVQTQVERRYDKEGTAARGNRKLALRLLSTKGGI
jgi:amine acid ABC transporter, permease protein, 3-TM region, His/Glu/Gln/Arg/opine family